MNNDNNNTLNINLDLGNKAAENKEKRVRAAISKNKAAKYVPTFDEVWVTGYVQNEATGKLKPGIMQTKLTPSDRNKLLEVKAALESGEIGFNGSLRELTKTKALALHKELMVVRREGIIKKMIQDKPDNYILVTDEKQLNDVVDKLRNEKIIAVDTETTGVNYLTKVNDYIVGVSITLPIADMHVYIPVRHNVEDKQLDADLVFKALKPFLEDETLGKVLHNYKFDAHMLEQEGVFMQGLHMDTMVAFHLLNENEPSFALKNLATKYGEYIGFIDKSHTYEELFGRVGFDNTPLDIATVYAAKDTHLTYKLSQWIEQQFNRLPQIKDLYFNIERRITEICVDMEREGFLIDLDFSARYKEELEKELADLLDDLYKEFGDINLNSQQQLQKLFYDTLGLPDVSKSKKVDASTLEILAKEYAPISKLLKYRELNKLLGTYIDPLPQKIAQDGRLHGSFNQSSTVTGRFASNKPNLQNLPKSARKMIVAAEDHIIIGVDYSQIEPRVLAHISKDENLQYPYITGQDLYSTLAAKVFNKPLEECGDGSKYRKMMKTGLLAVMYGTSTFTLAKQLGISTDEAEQFIQDFLNNYPDVSAFIDETKLMADNLGYVTTLDGRKRRFIGHKETAKRYHAIDDRIKKIAKVEKYNIREVNISRELRSLYYEVTKEYGRVSRQAVNAVIQGTAAFIMKKAMVDLSDYLKAKELETGKRFRLIGTIHDEVLIEIPADTTPDDVLEIAKIQRDAVTLDIPLKVDIEVSQRWGCGVSFDEWAECGGGLNVFNEKIL